MTMLDESVTAKIQSGVLPKVIPSDDTAPEAPGA
jgi:hypothetical protein